jgi:hypothetical protein
LNPSKALLMQHFFWHIVVLCRNASPIRRINVMVHPLLAFKQLWGMFKDLASLLKGKTWRLHHQFQETVLSWVKWISFVMPHTHWSLPCLSATFKRCFHQLQKLQCSNEGHNHRSVMRICAIYRWAWTVVGAMR